MSNQINETLLVYKTKQNKNYIDEILFISQKWMRRNFFEWNMKNKSWKNVKTQRKF